MLPVYAKIQAKYAGLQEEVVAGAAPGAGGERGRAVVVASLAALGSAALFVLSAPPFLFVQPHSLTIPRLSFFRATLTAAMAAAIAVLVLRHAP